MEKNYNEKNCADKSRHGCHESHSCGENANHSIGCTVTACSHHCGDENYCSLSKIEVTSHESNPTVVECTDCSSFQLKQ